MGTARVWIVAATLFVSLATTGAQAGTGRTGRIRAAIATSIGVKPSQVRFRSYPMGLYHKDRAQGERRYVRWRVRGDRTARGTAEVGLINGARPDTRLMNLDRGKTVNNRKLLKQLAARFGKDPDLYHSLRSSPVSPDEAVWSGKFPGPSNIMRTVRHMGGEDLVHYELRLGRQLVGYASDVQFKQPNGRYVGQRVFFDHTGRVVNRSAFVPEQ